MELLADGTGLISRESDVGKGVITLISTAETMADELALYRLNGLDDVMGAGICYVLLGLLRGGRINEKLALAAIAGVSAEDGIGGHWSWGGEARASEQRNNTAKRGPEAPCSHIVTKLRLALARSPSSSQELLRLGTNALAPY